MLAQFPVAVKDLNIPLRIKLPEGPPIELGRDPIVTLTVNDPTLLTQLSQPSLGLLGAAYVEGRIDLHGSIREVIRIGDELCRTLVADDLGAFPERTEHDRQTDADAISYHYDVSNAFYGLWLDQDMVYSCAYFETGNESLAQAQQAKLRHLCRKLRLKPGERLLDVGCGWGGLTRFAAREFDVDVFGITLSQQQLVLARERVEQEGLSHRIHLEFMDYRDLRADGRFDKAVSVGMFEHVGLANLGQYCQTLYGAVREGGLILNHGITALRTDGRQARNGAGEFIDRYVFPNGELPHLATMTAEISDAGMEVVDVESLRLHYARTLEHWSDRLEAKLEQAAREVPAEVLRIWRLYLAGCAYGFRRGWVNIHQILAAKPHADGSLETPWSRADLYT